MTTQRFRAVSAACAVALAALLIAVVAAGPAMARNRTTIGLLVSKHVKRNKVYNITVSGFAPKKTVAYLFVDYSACSPSFAIEDRRAAREVVKYPVSGVFTKISGWSSSLAESDHACAYLVGLGTGRVLATARATFMVH
jgi:hypothetical protein